MRVVAHETKVAVDCRKRQTAEASPAEQGDLLYGLADSPKGRGINDLLCQAACCFTLKPLLGAKPQKAWKQTCLWSCLRTGTLPRMRFSLQHAICLRWHGKSGLDTYEMVMPEGKQIVTLKKMLADFGEFSLNCQSLSEILTEACRLVSEALGTERAEVLEILHDTQCLLVRAGVGWQFGIVGRLLLPMSEFSSETFSIETGKPVICQDIRKEDRFDVPKFMNDAGVIALANVPIFLPGGRAYGLLQVDDRSPRDFGPQDTEFLRSYATLLGSVIDRLQKVEDLRASEERFRLIVENARDYAIYIADADDRITDWLPGAEAVFGWPAAEIAGKPGSVLFTPEDRERKEDEKEIETARAHGAAPNVRWHIRKDGQRVFIDGITAVLHGAEGKPRGFIKIGRDVTERRKAEERLRASEQRLRALVNATSSVVYRMSADWSGINQFCGDAFIADAQQPSEAWLSTYVYADDRPTVGEAIQEAIRTKGVFDLEHRSGRNDGTFGWTHSRAAPLLDEHGEISEWFGTATDVSARKQTEEALTDSEQRLSLALQVGGVIGTWDWDIRNDSLRADSRLAALFGVDREEAARGLPLKALITAIHPKDRDRVATSIQQISKSGGDYAEEHRIVQPEGTEQWVLARGRCLLNAIGTPYRFLGVAIDINERKRAEDHQKMLMAELDHRVKNLLAVIQSLAHRSLRGGDGEATGRFTGRLAALARAHTTLADSQWEGASLTRLATEAMSPHRDERPDGRVTVSGPDLLLTPKAAQALTLAFHELATNSAKYGALSIPAGRVTVEWKVHSDGARLLILVWREMGGPLIEAPPKVKGFGSMLIERSLTYELGGEVDLDYQPTGLVVTLTLPITALVTTLDSGNDPATGSGSSRPIHRAGALRGQADPRG